MTRVRSHARRRAPAEVAPRVTRFDAFGESFVVVSVPRADERHGLTAAEHAIATLIAAGLSNAEIARARERAVRTVANQVAAVLRKLGVDSRADVARVLAGTGTKTHAKK